MRRYITAHESLQKVATPLCSNGAIGRVASLIAWWSRVRILPSSKYFCTFHEIKLYLESNYIKIFTKESMRKDNKNFLLYIHLLINAKFLIKTFPHSSASHFTVSVYMHFKGGINYGLFHEKFFHKIIFRGNSMREIDCAHSQIVKTLPWPWFREEIGILKWKSNIFEFLWKPSTLRFF